jgi:hypothetical protein
LLEEAGLKEATAKRYVENSVGAIRMFELSGMDNATPEMVREFFDDSGIDSENKLAKAIKGEAEKSKAQHAGGTGGRQVVELPRTTTARSSKATSSKTACPTTTLKSSRSRCTN